MLSKMLLPFPLSPGKEGGELSLCEVHQRVLQAQQKNSISSSFLPTLLGMAVHLPCATITNKANETKEGILGPQHRTC